MANYTSSDVQVYLETFGLVTSAAPFIDGTNNNFHPILDRTAPVAAVNTPSAGSTLPASSTALVIDVTDDSTLKRVIIFASFSDGTPAEMVYDGTIFRTSYSSGSSRSVITGGARFSLVRASGWRTNPTISVYALDDVDGTYNAKNELNFTSFSWVYAADAAGPVISAYSPDAGSTLGSTDGVLINVVDSGGLSRVFMVAQFSDGSPSELVWDGAAGAGYIVSTSSITNGTRYTISRPAGWRSNPKIYMYGRDAFGNETLWTHVDYLHTPAIVYTGWELISATPLAVGADSSKIRIVSGLALLHVDADDKTDALHVANYIFDDDALKVVSVSHVSGGTTFDLFLDREMLQGTSYTLKVINVLSAAESANPDPTSGRDTKSFTGVGTAPDISSAAAGDKRIDVTFTEDLDFSTIQAVDFSVSALGPGAAVTVADIAPNGARGVRLKLREKMTHGESYRVSVTTGAVKDVAGNANGASTQEDFTGYATAINILSIAALSKTSVRVTFDADIADDADTSDTSNYSWDNGLQTTSAVYEGVRTVVLTTTEMQRGVKYTLTVG